jgi:uncharacterized protein YjbJ (UPF0337 family)
MGDTTDKMTGGMKEKAGNVTGSDKLKRKGRDEQAKANLKQTATKAKDTVKKSV